MKTRAKHGFNCGSASIKWTNPLSWSVWWCYDYGYPGPLDSEEEEWTCEVRRRFEEENDGGVKDDEGGLRTYYSDEMLLPCPCLKLHVELIP